MTDKKNPTPEGLDSLSLQKLLADKGGEQNAEKWQAAIRAIFDAAGDLSSDEPLMFQCRHCGGFHHFIIRCANCDVDIDASQAMEFGSLDKIFTLGVCKKCLSVSVALYRCHGIDPGKKKEQKEVAQVLKILPGGKK